MEMANYSDVLDPTYTCLEFENMQLIYTGIGKLLLFLLLIYTTPNKMRLNWKLINNYVVKVRTYG